MRSTMAIPGEHEMHNIKLALTVKEICKALGGVTPPTIYKEIAAGRLKTFKIGSRRFSTPEACQEYIRLREKEAE